MSLSSLRYQAELQRFQSKMLSQSITPKTPIENKAPVKFQGFNPDTGKQQFQTISGETVEAENNNQYASIPLGREAIISQGFVVG